ncbi:hypothetical protein M9458_033659, partial [Cirrhinus mrigala]
MRAHHSRLRRRDRCAPAVFLSSVLETDERPLTLKCVRTQSQIHPWRSSFQAE